VAVIERAARDLTSESGCRDCSAGHDAASGYGRLDGAAALASSIAAPPPDALEPNDDAGPGARRLARALRALTATLDRYDDRNDVYAVFLGRGERLRVQSKASNATAVAVLTPQAQSLAEAHADPRLVVARSPAARAHAFTTRPAPRSGWYAVHVHLTAGGRASYELRLARR
jgi:hypothetical protein